MADPAEHESLDMLSIIILTVIFGSVGIVIYLLFLKKNDTDDSQEQEQPHTDPAAKKLKESTSDSSDSDKKAAKASNQSKKAQGQKKKDIGASHPLLYSILKGHTGAVCGFDFSSNGKLVASCSEDRTVRLWNVKDFALKEHKYTRGNVEFDYPSCISLSPDSRAFIVALGTEHLLRVYKIHKTKKEDGTPHMSVTQEFDFPKEHKIDIISVAISPNGKYIMSADKKTNVVIWTTKGEILERIDTLLIYNTHVCVSPCGNLVAACGFTPEVKFWHIGFNKNNEFLQSTKTMGLKGHSDSVLSFSFTNDSKRVATISKDQTWRIWDIDVDYLKGQDAYLLITGSHVYEPDVPVHIALSPDHFTVAISLGRSIQLINAASQELDETLDNVHPGDISALQWFSDSRQLASAGGLDKSIRLWHNVPGIKASIADLTSKLPKAKSESLKERIQVQINEAQDYLAKFQYKSNI